MIRRKKDAVRLHLVDMRGEGAELSRKKIVVAGSPRNSRSSRDSTHPERFL